jgi:hypothetical protein
VHVSPNAGDDVLIVGAGLLSQVMYPKQNQKNKKKTKKQTIDVNRTTIPYEGGDGIDTLIVDNSQSQTPGFANFSTTRIQVTDLVHDITYHYHCFFLFFP